MFGLSWCMLLNDQNYSDPIFRNGRLKIGDVSLGIYNCLAQKSLQLDWIRILSLKKRRGFSLFSLFIFFLGNFLFLAKESSLVFNLSSFLFYLNTAFFIFFINWNNCNWSLNNPLPDISLNRQSYWYLWLKSLLLLLLWYHEI